MMRHVAKLAPWGYRTFVRRQLTRQNVYGAALLFAVVCVAPFVL